jgi:hypothetical protein
LIKFKKEIKTVLVGAVENVENSKSTVCRRVLSGSALGCCLSQMGEQSAFPLFPGSVENFGTKGIGVGGSLSAAFGFFSPAVYQAVC